MLRALARQPWGLVAATTGCGLSMLSTPPAADLLAAPAAPRAAVVVGVSHSPGLGYAVAKRFAEGGLAVGLVGRQPERLEACRREILDAVPGATVTYVAADATDEAQVAKAFGELKAKNGPADVLVFNMSCRPFPPTAVADLEPGRLMSDIKTGPLAFLLCVQQVLPEMRQSGRGAVLVSGASASMRGTERFGAFASSKMALRGMCQSLAKEVAPSGVHVAHVIVDAMVDMPIINGFFPDVSKGRLLDTAAAAEVYWQLYQQDQRCMSFEVDVRPFEAKW